MTSDSSKNATGLPETSERPLVDAAWAQFERLAGRRTAARPDASAVVVFPGYRVIGEIHRGGQGVVYQAIQESTGRKVAIKVLKQGPFAGRDELARFDLEVDVLSRLNHPHIVTIHDRGVTAGHAYFVMDYIPGQSLDSYVAGGALSVNEVLALFARVCDAVNVAHLRGVIHRDLKPGNIRMDERGEPRILDFGLAKLEGDSSEDARSLTLTGQFVGSIPWASPEQASGCSEQLDVRTDVYSLGVILYQLLTRHFPYAVTGRIDDVIRQITTAPPTKPSSYVRGLDHDVEIILLKCLAKEPERRYQSAGELARDVRHALAHEPVSATSPSAAYRLSKFVRRNRGFVAAGAAVAITLVAATVVSVGFGIGEARQRRAADAARTRAETAEEDAKRRASELEQVAKFQEAQLAGISAQEMGKQLQADLLEKVRAASARESTPPGEIAARISDLEKLLAGSDFTGLALKSLDDTYFKPALTAIHDQFSAQPLVQARLLQALASTMRQLGLLDAATRPQEEALALRRGAEPQSPETLRSIKEMGYLLWSQGKLEEAETLAREAVEKHRLVLGEDDPETLDSLDKLATLLRERGKLADAETFCREAMAGRQRVLGDLNSDTLASMANLSNLLRTQGKLEESEALDRQALEKYRRLLGDDHPHTLIAINNLAVSLQGRGKLAEAEVLQREALERSRRVLGEEHPDTLTSVANIAMLLKVEGKLAEAEALCREAVAKRRRVLGEDHPYTLMTISNLGNVLTSEGKLSEAEPVVREVLERRRRLLGDAHADTLTSLANLSFILHQRGKLVEAEEFGRDALKKRRQVLGEDHPLTLSSMNNMAMLLKDAGKLDEAEAFCRDVVEKRRRLIGDSHPDTITSILNLGLLLKSRGKISEAEPYNREALESGRRLLGDAHPLTLMAIGGMGAVLLASGKPAEAIALVAPAEPAARKAFTGDNAVRLGRLLTVLGRSRTAIGEFDAAERNLNEAYEIELHVNNAAQKNRTEITEGLSELYAAWNKAEPGKGHDAKADEWREKLAE